MKVYLYPASGENRYGDALYRAMSEHGELLYSHVSSSPSWGMSDLRSGLRYGYGYHFEDENELIEGQPPESVLLAAQMWEAVSAPDDAETR